MCEGVKVHFVYLILCLRFKPHVGFSWRPLCKQFEVSGELNRRDVKRSMIDFMTRRIYMFTAQLLLDL